jgi:hypothetical protein
MLPPGVRGAAPAELDAVQQERLAKARAVLPAAPPAPAVR